MTHPASEIPADPTSEIGSTTSEILAGPTSEIAAYWPADLVERRATGSLVPSARNARTHSAAQVDQIAASIREFGFTIPILVDEQDEIIAGHGRVLAAQQLGLDSLPTMTAKGWTPQQIAAYRIADNKLALNAGWDTDMLAAELAGLASLVSLTGFTEDELLALALPANADDAPLPSAEDARRTLAQRFGLPPFTVLNAREGWWQERKRAFLALGIESELGRGDSGGRRKANGKSAARTFGQDLMRGEHVVGGRKKAKANG